METTLNKYFVSIYLGLFLIENQCQAQTLPSPYPEFVVQDKYIQWPNILNTYDVFYSPNILTSPGENGLPVEIRESALVELKAGNEIKLTDGFLARDFNDGTGLDEGGFIAHIDKPMDVQVINPTPPLDIDANNILHIKRWEKFELGIIPPDYFITAVNNFFDHYWINTVNPTTDLNPYAFDSLEVKFLFTRPDGTQLTKWAFFMREAKWDNSDIGGQPDADLLITDEDSSNALVPFKWHLRFAPDQVNATVPWKFSVTVSAPHSSQSAFPPFIIDGFRFICDPELSDNNGFLKVHPSDNGMLQFENGEPFFGIGENMVENYHGAWPITSNQYDKDNFRFYALDFNNFLNTVDQFSSAGGNFFRLGFQHNTFTPEHEHLGVYDAYIRSETCEGPLWANCGSSNPQPCCNGGREGNRQSSCWAFDKIVDRMREKNVYAMLEVEFFQPIIAIETNWGDDVYYRNFVKPNSSPPFDVSKYFTGTSSTSADALYYWKRRYKYILSRWGYSVNIPIISTFNELSQTLGYSTFTAPADAHQCCGNFVQYGSNPSIVRDAIEQWHNEIIGFVKNPDPQIGLNETNHLISVNFAEALPTTAPEIQDYLRIYDNSLIDLVDFHSYENAINMNQARYDKMHDILSGPNSIMNTGKPFLFGECGTLYCPIEINPGPPAVYANVAPYYNNSEITFHNMIWATAMMGSYSTGLDWNWQLNYKWAYTNPNPIGQLPSYPVNANDPIYYYDQDPSLQNAHYFETSKIITYYHNYKPLKDFFAQLFQKVNFNQSLVNHKIYDVTRGLECYYQTTNDNNSGFGWIHNLSHFWENKYYYDYLNFEWSGGSSPNIVGGLTFEGLTAGIDYQIDFYYTRMGTTPVGFPTTATITANINGEVVIPANSNLLYLGNDTSNADIAFTLLPYFAQNDDQRLSNQKPHENEKPDFTITVFPNPVNGRLNLVIDKNNYLKNNVITSKIKDLTGRTLLRFERPFSTISTYELSPLSKGSYFIEVEINKIKKYKKIIVQ